MAPRRFWSNITVTSSFDVGDRAIGVVLGGAVGDALGAGYEFQYSIPADTVTMRPGVLTGRPAGQWTDDTDMAIALALATLAHGGAHTTAAQDDIVRRWVEWADAARDIGVQTRGVLSGLGGAPTAAAASAAAKQLHEATGRSGGNGSLMRTAPLALAYLNDPDVLWQVAQDVSALTHFDPAAGEACALWCMAIRHAVLEGTFDGMRDALHRLPADRRAHWEQRLDAAEAGQPWHFPNNGWVETAFQAAWCAVVTTPEQPLHPQFHVFPAQTAGIAIERAVRAGHDTDTVAAIAGSLIGARWGMSALPSRWLSAVHGWPGMRANDLQQIGRAHV